MLEKLAKKGLRTELPREAGTQFVDGDKVPEPSSEFSQSVNGSVTQQQKPQSEAATFPDLPAAPHSLPTREENVEPLPAGGPVPAPLSQASSHTLHPLDLEYKRLRNANMAERIETQKALRIKATQAAILDTVQCPKCKLMLLKANGYEHIRNCQVPAVYEGVFREDGRAIGPYCFKHGRIEPADSLCFPLSREDLIKSLAK